MERFKEDEVYVATPCMKDVKKRFFIILYRDENEITGCFLDNLISCDINMQLKSEFYKEFAHVVDPVSGHKFNLDSDVGRLSNPSDVANLLKILRADLRPGLF